MLIGGYAVLRQDHASPVKREQPQGIKELDRELRKGSRVGGIRYTSPALQPRAQFAASIILQSLRKNQNRAAHPALALICIRMPKAHQVQYRRRDGRYDIAFITGRDDNPGEQSAQMHRIPEP